MEEEMTVLSYKEVLNKIESQENHLLIGNGFNRGLGINTSYTEIFNKMINDNLGIYEDAMEMVEQCEHDLESFIGKLEGDINPENLFLRKYIRNKVKMDFMKATHKIVKSEIKTIYAEQNEGVFLLLQNFTNYFSLNYDSFLYLLLLNFKPLSSDDKNAIVLQTSIKFIEEDLNDRLHNVYREIKIARAQGNLQINLGVEGETLEKPLSKTTKTLFIKAVNEYSKTNNKGWQTKDIKRVVDKIFEEEQRNHIQQSIDDGCKQLSLYGDKAEFVFDPNSKTQNLFFLHGAFHIYKDGQSIKKITQQTDKALYDRLEEILNNEEQEIVCVFQQQDKTEVINQNEYLQNCLNKLGKLEGNLVIIGSSLADNDNHIFEQVNKSDIGTLYITTFLNEKEKRLELAKKKFPSKDIYLFDAETISYELPDD